jgi:hypothetical protein
MHDFAAARGMANVNGVFQIEMGGDRSQIIGIVIHVVTIAYLRRAAMAATIMRNHAVAVF